MQEYVSLWIQVGVLLPGFESWVGGLGYRTHSGLHCL